MIARRLLVVMLALAGGVSLAAVAVCGKDRSKDSDEPPPLRLGSGGDAANDDSPKIVAPVFRPDNGPGPAGPATRSSRRPDQRGSARSEDSSSPGYGSDAARASSARREEMIGKVEGELEALPVSGGGKREESDLFVVGTIDVQDHRATIDFPIIQGIRKAAEHVADFMLDKSGDAVRQWKAFGRAKNQKAAEVLRRKARDMSIEGKLEAFKLSKSGRKSIEDFFVVGTAEVFTATQHADIRFQVVGGTKQTASFLLDFILAGNKETQRQWHVFFRAKTQEDADQYIAQLRNWYDTLESQRSKIAEIYHARTTRRC